VRVDAPLERVAIDVLHGGFTVARDDLDPRRQTWNQGAPGRSEPGLQAAPSPLAGAPADMIGSEEPFRPGTGQIRGVSRSILMGQADPSAIDQSFTEVPVQLALHGAVPRHVHQRHRLTTS